MAECLICLKNCGHDNPCDCFVYEDDGEPGLLTKDGAEHIGRRMRAIANRVAKIEETACKQERVRLKAEMLKPPEEMAWVMYCRLYDKYGGINPGEVPEEAALQIAQRIMDERVAKAEVGGSNIRRPWEHQLTKYFSHTYCRSLEEADGFSNWLVLAGHSGDRHLATEGLRELLQEFREQVVEEADEIKKEDCGLEPLLRGGVISEGMAVLFREWLQDHGHIQTEGYPTSVLKELWYKFRGAEE